MRKLFLLMALIAVTGIASANLLTNGDFEAGTTEFVDWGFEGSSWEHWGWNDGFSERLIPDTSGDDGWKKVTNGTYVVNVGNGWYNGGGGAFQIVAATAGQIYKLSVDSGAETWWQPTGEMAMIWLDENDAELGKKSRFTVDPAVYGGTDDTPHPWSNYAIWATAPVGATQVKVEFASRMPDGIGGAIVFDNAVLTVVEEIPEPATMVLLGLGGLLLRRKK